MVATTPRPTRQKPRALAQSPGWAGPPRQALLLLRVVFTVAPSVFGLDKRDFRLLVAALALSRLASEPAGPAPFATTTDNSRSGTRAGRG
jgi:hypothetical protein